METNIDREENARGCLTHSSPALEAGVSCLGKDDEIAIKENKKNGDN